MAGTCRISVGVLACFLGSIPSASAFGGYYGYWPAPAINYAYYWPAPAINYAYYYPYAYSYCPPRPVTVIRLGNACEAIPTPAPPSQTPEPPTNKKPDLRAPIINSTRSLGGSFRPDTAPLSKERCKVGFWNLTGRDVTLTIDGRTWTLPKNRKIVLELDHQFSWQADRGPQLIERVPDDQATHEVVVRQ